MSKLKDSFIKAWLLWNVSKEELGLVGWQAVA